MAENKYYEVKIVETSRELTPRERVKIKDTGNAVQIDDATADTDTPLVIDYDYHVVLEVHNEKSDNKDYRKVVVVDKAGNKFVTGSDSFLRAMSDIVEEMHACGETDIQLEVYRKPSKNYKGKSFITCSVI